MKKASLFTTYITKKEVAMPVCLAEDDSRVNSSNHNSDYEEEEDDDSEANHIGQQCENCRQTESQT